MSPAEPDFLRKENSWFFFGFSVYVIWISAWILRDSWCIISMSIFFDAAEKWKKSKSWIEDSKAAVPHLLLLRFEGHHNLSIASFWRTFDPYHLLINSPVTLPIPANFPYYVTTKTPLENLLASLMFQGQEFFAFTMFENDTKWYKMRLWVIFQKFSPMQFPKYFFWSRATIEEITGCFRGCRR